MSIPRPEQNTIPEADIQVEPARWPTNPAEKDPLQQAEALLAKFAAGGWLLTGGFNATAPDNRTALAAAMQIATLRQQRQQHAELVAVLDRIAEVGELLRRVVAALET